MDINKSITDHYKVRTLETDLAKAISDSREKNGSA
jgi:hypothetical protein